MATAWIKVEANTPDKPEVIRMATLLRLDQDAVTGKLLRVWIWADANSVDGQDIPITAAFIDRLTDRKGFAAAMQAVGWLTSEEGTDTLTIPNFGHHNGESAKARAESARRMAKSRANHKDKTQPDSHASQTNVAPFPQQKPQPDKRREDKNPNGLGGRGGGGGSGGGSVWALQQQITAAKDRIATLQGIDKFSNLSRAKQEQIRELRARIATLEKQLAHGTDNSAA